MNLRLACLRPMGLLLILAGCRRAAPGHEVPLYALRQLAISPPALELTDVRSLALGSHGQVLVGDLGGQVLELGPDAALRRRLGGRGRGPGEFDAVDQVQLLAGDSVLVFDGSLARVSIFPPASERVARSVDLSSGSYLFPYWVAASGRGGTLWAAYRAAFGDVGPGSDAPHRELLRLLSPDGRVLRDSVQVFAEMETLQLRGEVEGVAVNPFGRRRLLARGPDDRLFSAWTGELAVEVANASGRHLATLRPRLAITPRPVTAAERDSVIDLMSRHAFPAAVVRRAFVAAGSRRWPLFREMFVDPQGLLWLGLVPAPGGNARWRAFAPDGTLRAGLDLPANESLRMVAAGRGYVVRRDADDVPRVVIYALALPTAGRTR
jgi:hypothetical protein